MSFLSLISCSLSGSPLLRGFSWRSPGFRLCGIPGYAFHCPYSILCRNHARPGFNSMRDISSASLLLCFSSECASHQSNAIPILFQYLHRRCLFASPVLCRSLLFLPALFHPHPPLAPAAKPRPYHLLYIIWLTPSNFDAIGNSKSTTGRARMEPHPDRNPTPEELPPSPPIDPRPVATVTSEVSSSTPSVSLILTRSGARSSGVAGQNKGASKPPVDLRACLSLGHAAQRARRQSSHLG